jgi:hypothetical protein
MQKRGVRVVLFALLVAVVGGAGVLIFTVEQRVRALDATEREVTGEIDRLIAALKDVEASQAGYVGPGQNTDAWMDRATTNLQRVTADTEMLRMRLQSVEAAPRLQAVGEAVVRLSRLDATIRQDIAAGDTFLASDRIFGDARRIVDGATNSLRQLRDAESNAFLSQRESVVQESWAALAGAGALWILGLALLLPRATRLVPVPAADAPADGPVVPAADASTGVDLNAAADLCTSISRVTSADALPDLLARAAAIVDASGVIVWMGAGEELFAVTAFGYDARTLARLGPIAISAQNATAAAWRTGQTRTVAGDAATNGAIVAPMFGPSRCIGVLAAEVRHGREHDADARAVVTMVAAQLATAVAAWPSASTSQSKAG